MSMPSRLALDSCQTVADPAWLAPPLPGYWSMCICGSGHLHLSALDTGQNLSHLHHTFTSIRCGSLSPARSTAHGASIRAHFHEVQDLHIKL